MKLRNGFTPYENLLICIGEGTATAETFEAAIQEEGLTMNIIKLLSQYYKDDLKEEEPAPVEQRAHNYPKKRKSTNQLFERSNKKWTKEEEEHLIRVWHKYSLNQLCLAFERTPNGIKKKAQKLGLPTVRHE